MPVRSREKGECMSDPERHVVRPFGLIGGDYEVDDAGRRKYVLAWVLAAVAIGVWFLRGLIDAPAWVFAALSTGAFVAVVALCADIVRNGRKL